MEIDGSKEVDQIHPQYSFLHSLVAGGVAGVVVDIALFPIDTVKTRLQSELGFMRAGGFRGVYKGLAPAAAGSAPTAAIFFCCYEGFKRYFSTTTGVINSPYVHMVSASCAEVLACLIRVPVEIAKQRRQTLGNTQKTTALQILWRAYKLEGLRRGLYRGFSTTVMREIPFSLIQFPMWEYFKLHWTATTGMDSTPFTVALCGAMAGGIAAGLTTPLDVAKTRIMLAEQGTATRKLNPRTVLAAVYRERGFAGLFAGFAPRVLWITLGGAFFFGFYDLTLRLLRGTVAADNPNI
ncbi:PREDICTED: S-adenosylmethionine mitochondrial carrier protein homolog [Rhagoletis zephyria]|uniref:S-adenosylmethionine mitochondrial carrier protein homolog n=1 Tax=Rhagoletis zephyria TaxID=28612 RepID=UPI0008115DBA|nr:PREDICTED: S-adenosylmethionine mitochondrial carrier protein homolog [Rhagoletis zephyria]XP_036328250.1 S-adenosylmethionine mitochondrial carrier protein homolog [Rhagoletis pomonella]